MPKRHIRDRKLKALEATPKIISSAQAGLQKTIGEELAKYEKAEQILGMHGLPSDLPSLAEVTHEDLNTTIGTIARSGGLLNMNNPAMQGIGAIGLAYALKPELVRGFLGSEVGSTLVGAASSYILGSSAGEMLGDSATLSTGVGAGVGYALGVTLGVPGIGLVFGGLGGLFGGRKKRRAKRRSREEIRKAIWDLDANQNQARAALETLRAQKDNQRAALEQFLDYTDSAKRSLALGKQSIDLQRTRLKEQRDINMGIAAKNEREIRRVANVRNETIKRETEKLLGKQKVQMGMSGTSFAGSWWYIEGETIDMGLKAEQEVNLRMKSELEAQAIEYREMMKSYNDLSSELDYAEQKVTEEVSMLDSEARTRANIFAANLRALDAQTKAISMDIERKDRRVAELTGRYNNLGGNMRYTPFDNNFRWDTTKEQKLLEKVARKAGALTAMSLGDAIRTTQAGSSPYDVLINYGMFS